MQINFHIHKEAPDFICDERTDVSPNSLAYERENTDRTVIRHRNNFEYFQ